MSSRGTSIGGKINRISMISTAAALLLAGGVIDANNRAVLAQLLPNNLSVLATVIGTNGAAAIAFEDKEAAGKILAALKAEPHVTNGALYNGKGELFATYRRDDAAPAQFPKELLSEGYKYQDRHLVVFHHIDVDNETIGTVYLRSELTVLRMLFARNVGIIALVMIGALLAVYALSKKMQRTITGPILTLKDAATRIEQGNLSTEISVSTTDEIGALAAALRNMVGYLRGTTVEIQQGTSILAAAASEILASVTHVVAAASETATAVTETVTTIEEVKQTAQISSDRAKSVAEITQEAVSVSNSGEKSVAKTVEEMNRIRAQMDAVAESIVKLSEQCQMIGEIIMSVQDLADQSNLLAVNAAIEAAKAGEQGKGFAVVATEVRNLAEQSRQATVQVRNLLNDIQKATSAAVMATEQANKAVAAGAQQSLDSGESIRRLAQAVTNTAQAVIQIATSSKEQLVGVDQVLVAIESIKNASAHNVENMKLVESEAKKVSDLGNKLKGLGERYRI